jgi:glutaminase
VAGASGAMFAAAHAGHELTATSVPKSLVFALVCELIGPEDARLGVDSTGLPCSSLDASSDPPTAQLIR